MCISPASLWSNLGLPFPHPEAYSTNSLPPASMPTFSALHRIYWRDKMLLWIWLIYHLPPFALERGETAYRSGLRIKPFNSNYLCCENGIWQKPHEWGLLMFSHDFLYISNSVRTNGVTPVYVRPDSLHIILLLCHFYFLFIQYIK